MVNWSTNQSQKKTFLPTMTTTNNNNANDCVICLEPLASDTVGACVPCGHCFHEHCWQNYKKTTRGRGRRVGIDDSDGIKCPMCNGISNAFCKIFIDFNTMPENNNNNDDEYDDDSASLSSVESSSSSSSTSSPSCDKQKDTRKDISSDRTGMPIVIDLVNDENNNNNDKENHHPHLHHVRRRVQKYKRKGKALKQTIEQCKCQLLQSNKDLEQLEHDHRTVQASLQALQAPPHNDYTRVEHDLDGMHLASITASRKLQQTRASIVQLQHNLVHAVQNLDAYTKLHQQNVAQAYEQSLNAADAILVQHPQALQQHSRLRQQNDALRKQLNKLEKQILQLQQPKKGSCYRSSSNSSSGNRSSSSKSMAPPPPPPALMAQQSAKQMNSTPGNNNSKAPRPTSAMTPPPPSAARASVSVATKMRTAANNNNASRGVVISQEDEKKVEDQNLQQQTAERHQQHQKQQDKPHHQQQQQDKRQQQYSSRHDAVFKRKVSEQAARMDHFLSRKAPRRGALELLQRSSSATKTSVATTTKASSSSSSASGTTASRTATAAN
jgi:Ring finger domain